MRVKLLVTYSAMAMSALLPGPSFAGFNSPYLASYAYSGKLADCVQRGQQALERQGYKVDEVKYSDSKKSAWIYSRHSEFALGATIECKASEGRTAVSVAGMNDKEAFESFLKLTKEEW